MKGELTLKILESIEKMTVTAGELFTIALSPYGSSLRGIDRQIADYHRERDAARNVLRDKQVFYNLLYRLKRDGLIEARQKNDRRSFKITVRGLAWLGKMRLRRTSALPSPQLYLHKIETTIKIVVFDIPERERRKRDWLRGVLVNLGFRMLQRSVWIGKAKIPEALIHDLKRLRLLPCVEILSVTKTGSLKQLV